jgi:hypothetical protein
MSPSRTVTQRPVSSAILGATLRAASKTAATIERRWIRYLNDARMRRPVEYRSDRACLDGQFSQSRLLSCSPEKFDLDPQFSLSSGALHLECLGSAAAMARSTSSARTVR